MLLNLSNHPSSAWSAEQLRAATEQFGGVVDMPFPNIDPYATSEELRQLVAQYQQNITNLPNIKAVHLMGEMTFTYQLVNSLQAIDLPCYASTTERTVLEEADGRKTVQFQFVQFRQYC